MVGIICASVKLFSEKFCCKCGSLAVIVNFDDNYIEASTGDYLTNSIELTIPYQILEMPWSTQEFVKLETERTQIVFSLYPVKKTIVLNEG